jgi:hypothetical protein
VSRVARGVGWTLVGLVVAGMTAWGTAALHYAPLPPALRTALTVLFPAATALAFAVLPRRRRTLAGFLAAFAVLVVWWCRIPPSNDRDWQVEVSRTPWATFDGDLVTVHDIRNFAYRTETDFTPRWYDRTFDLAQLDEGDLVASYWAGPTIAHLFVSFGFGGRYLAVSIETRKERGEGYSTVAGFFKQYELVYVAADERDLIGVRTTYRQPNEDVYVFRTRIPRENLRRLFLDYVTTMNRLHARPAWYNTLTTNCTTGILLHSRVNPGHPPWSWKVLLSGYAPEYVYDLGKLDTGLPFEELKRRSRVNDRARAADGADDFSERIRVGLP